MNKTFLKVFTLLLIVTGCIIVLVYGSPTKQKASAHDTVIDFSSLDSKELPTGAKSKLTLNKDSTTPHGDVAFDHDTHSFNKYSIDGKTDIGCAECHHTDQPKSALSGLLITSERTEMLTKESLTKAGAPDVKSCRTCHFQEGKEPEGKENPSATYEDAKGKPDTKVLDNLEAYHRNCNVCHDKAVAARPQLKKKKGFATGGGGDCFICHIKN